MTDPDVAAPAPTPSHAGEVPPAVALYAEPYAPTGNLGDSGVRKLLGAPSTGLLQTLVRESVQNSCDAARDGREARVDFRIRRLGETSRTLLAEHVLLERPAGAESSLAFASSLDAGPVRVLEICDRNTIGLGGPTRADRIPPGTDTTDFIDFLRNVGTARDTDQGGGTYGFGKVALYLASRCATVVVDTVARGDDGFVRRLMACHLGPAWSDEAADGYERRHTGRHWWGASPDADGLVEPVTGAAAAALARGLGLPERGRADTGTTIMVIDPDLDGLEPRAAGEHVVGCLLHTFWPRMTRDTPAGRRIAAGVEVDGETMPVPAPEDFPPLDLFARALSRIRADGGGTVPIAMSRPKRRLGTMAIERGLRAARVGPPPAPPVRDAEGGAEPLFPPRSAHVAIMRPVGFVVRYLEGRALPDERVEWAGVFIADSDDETEAAFAAAEPPAHDDWQPGIVPDRRWQSMVRVALRRIGHQMNLVVAAPAAGGLGDVGSAGPSVTDVAGRLGTLLSRGAGSGDPVRRAGRRAARGARGMVVAPVETAGLEQGPDGAVALFRTRIERPEPGATLVATPMPAVDGTAHRVRNEDGLPALRVRGMRTADGRMLCKGGELPVELADGTVEILVPVPAGTAVTLRLSIAGAGR